MNAPKPPRVAGGYITFGPGQGFTGEIHIDLQAGLGCILVGTFYPTKPSAERQSLARWYTAESDYGVRPPAAELWISDTHDLVFQVSDETVAIKAEILAPFFGKPIALIAMAQCSGNAICQLELEVNGELRASEIVKIDLGPSSAAINFQVIGCSSTTFELTQWLITKRLGHGDRAKLVEYFREQQAPNKVVFSHRDFPSSSPPSYAPDKSPIEEHPKRAVIDTNVLLDASLVSDGFGAKALAVLRGAGVSLFVDDIAYQDAVRILRKHKHRTTIPFEALERLLVDCSTRHTILSVPPGDGIQGLKVKRQDLHLARAATTLDAFIVTDDAPLRHQLFVSNIPAAMSRELAVLTFGDNPPPAPYLLGGLSLGQRSSFIFARCRASPAILNDGRVEATLWDGEDIGQFFYDVQREAFVFRADWGPELAHPFKIIPGREIVLATFFDFHPSRITLGIRTEYFDGGAVLPSGGEKVGSSQHFLARPSVLFGQRGLTIANRRTRKNTEPRGWPGSIHVMTWGPGKIDAASWKTFRAVERTAPNPFTSDVVGVAISLIQSDGSFVSLPRLSDVMAQVSNATLMEEPR
ncbi:hypothetical protein [Reyranella sp.]|uniref:hypothetical protein n=1 Tax=Reyranella sp. TaxID=1929291 RepID=UPI003D0DAC09